MLQNLCQQEIVIKSTRFIIRRLEPSDYNKGFLQLLSQLTVTPIVSDQQFDKTLQKMNNDDQLDQGVSYTVLVVEELESKKIVATGTLFVEQTLFDTIGNIENIVTDFNFRGYGFAKLILNSFSDAAKKMDIKISQLQLYCTEELKEFYQKQGFQEIGCVLSKYNENI